MPKAFDRAEIRPQRFGTPDDRPGLGQTNIKGNPGSYPRRSLTRELGGQYPELFQESKDS